MSDILIKGIEMPKNCLSCPLQGGTADCRLTQKTYNWGLTERPSDCPLVPVPPHGRLIDADKADSRFTPDFTELSDFQCGWNAAMKRVCKDAPAIIPADEGEK